MGIAEYIKEQRGPKSGSSLSLTSLDITEYINGQWRPTTGPLVSAYINGCYWIYQQTTNAHIRALDSAYIRESAEYINWNESLQKGAWCMLSFIRCRWIYQPSVKSSTRVFGVCLQQWMLLNILTIVEVSYQGLCCLLTSVDVADYIKDRAGCLMSTCSSGCSWIFQWSKKSRIRVLDVCLHQCILLYISIINEDPQQCAYCLRKSVEIVEYIKGNWNPT